MNTCPKCGFASNYMTRCPNDDNPLAQIREKLGNMPEWAEGAAACAGGMLDSFNPYEVGSLQSKAWALGWKDAKESDAAL